MECVDCIYKKGTIFNIGDKVIILGAFSYKEKGKIVKIADSKTNTDPWYLVKIGLFKKEWYEWNFLRKIIK